MTNRKPRIGCALVKPYRWVVLTLCLLVCLGASAELSRVGPIDRANGYPAWYQDKSGLTLDSCVSASQAELNGGWCLILPANLPTGQAPEVFPNNFSEEHFYWSANSGLRRVPVPGTNQQIVVMLVGALEGAFASGPVRAGDQMVFARVRLKISPVPYDGTYTVYTPFGKFVFENQLASDPRGIFFTEDIGLTPGNFSDALNGRIGPFLLPSATPGGAEVPPIPNLAAGQDPFYDALVAAGAASAYPQNGKKYIADPARLGPVTGSPLPDYVVNDGTTRNPNIFRVEGPNGFVFETSDFALSGRVYEGPISGQVTVDRASYARSSATSSTVDVYASAFPAVQGRLPAGPPSATLSTHLAFFDAPCTATVDAQGNAGPPYSAPASATANQMFARGATYFGQSHPGAVPAEVCVQANAVDGAGNTVTSYIPTLLRDQVFITEALYDPANQSLSVKAASSDQVVAQTLTAEGFGQIPADGHLVISPILAVPHTIKVLSSGSGLNEMQVSTGAVAASAPPMPTAVNDVATTAEDTPVTIDLLGNDTNAATGTITIVTPPVLGTYSINGGTVVYTPNLNANGADSFTYRVTVGTQVSNDASVNVTITPVNDPPVAVNDNAGALRGVANSVNVLANDTDPDGPADLASAVIVTGNSALGIAAGTVFNGGVITFTPPSTTAGGVYTFTYNAVDKSGVPSATPATVTVSLSSLEVITPTKAIYTVSKARWTVSGTVNPIAGQTMTITYVDGTYKVNGACTGSAANFVVARVVTDATGTWNFDQVLTSTTGMINPSNTLGNSNGFWCSGPKTLKITSSLSNAVTTSAISLK